MPLLLRVVRRSTCPISTKTDRQKLSSVSCSPDRGDYVVITKYSGTREVRPSPGTTGNSRKTMIRSLEGSLKRLNTDYVDVFMPHFPDGRRPWKRS